MHVFCNIPLNDCLHLSTVGTVHCLSTQHALQTRAFIATKGCNAAYRQITLYACLLLFQ